jgi:putative membrane protein insertion efficiency factor
MKNILLAPFKFYQKFISPAFAPKCKYYPSCSQYAIDAITAYGLFLGFTKSVWRLMRCNPWSHGGVDYAVKKESSTSTTTLVGVK